MVGLLHTKWPKFCFLIPACRKKLASLALTRLHANASHYPASCGANFVNRLHKNNNNKAIARPRGTKALAGKKFNIGPII